MDYIFNNVITNISDNEFISCYYIVDDDLKYISIYDSDIYYLHYIDNTDMGELIMQSGFEGELDYNVLKLSSPIEFQISTFEKDARIVKIKTLSGNAKILKQKKSTHRTVLIRNTTKRNRLF